MSQPTLSDSALKELISSSDANTKGHSSPVLDGDEDANPNPGPHPGPLETLEDIFLDITEDIDNSEAVCENNAEERVALVLPTEQITHAADQLIENATADNMYSVYKIMDCDDEYTTGSQKVFLAAATATTISTVMVATKALLGSYHTFNGLTDRVNELEAKLAATEEDLEECEETVELKEEEIEEQEREIELKDEQIFIQETEIKEQKEEIAEQEEEIEEQEEEIAEQEEDIAEQEEEIAGLEESLAAAAVAANAALDLIDGAAEIIETALGIESDAECEAELEEKDEEIFGLEESIAGLEESLAAAAIAGTIAMENVIEVGEQLEHINDDLHLVGETNDEKVREETLDDLEEDVQEAIDLVDETEAGLAEALGLGDESLLEESAGDLDDEEITA